MRITGFSVDRPVSITMLVMIVMVLGGLALSRIGVDMLPDIDMPTLSVMVRYPGAPPEEIETIVCKNYEGTLASVNGVTKVHSVSLEDACYLMIDFEWGTDLDAAAADIREAVAILDPYMPPDVEDPIVMKFSMASMPAAVYTVSGMDDTIALRKLMEDSVQDRLERLEGIAQAPFIGGRVEEVHVNVDRAALYGSGVSLEQVVMAIGAQNLNLPAGRQIHHREEVLLRTVGMFDHVHDMDDIAVGMSPATMTPVRLASIATVEQTTRDVRSFVRANGYEALMLILIKESGANPLQVRRAYLEKLDELREVLPQNVHFGMLFDTGKLIAMLARGVAQNGVLGALLAVLIMYLFLRAVRPTLTIAVVIPLSLLATFIPIYAIGETLNMMTMGGLLLGIGMLVDNAVVVIENIFRHLEEGESRKEAAKEGAGEVGMAITASTFTTIVVFLPILFSQGLAGQLAFGLAITVAAALFCSLFVALTIVPMLASVFFSSRHEGSVLRQGRRFHRFRIRYQATLRWCLRHRLLTLGGVGLLALLSLVLVPLVGAEFMPAVNRPILLAKVSFPPGTPLETTSEACERVEEQLARIDDVLTVGVQIGVDENDSGAALSDTNPSGPNEAMIFARLKDSRDRKIRANDQLQKMVRERVPPIEGMEFEFIDMSGGMGGSTYPIEVKLFGSDFEVLKDWSEVIAKKLESIEGLADVDTTLRAAKPEQHIRIDRAKAARYGLTVGQVASSLKTATLGTIATRLRTGGDELDVRVQYAEPWRSTQQDLEQVLISPPTGGTIPLGQIATFEDGWGPVRIVRDDQSRVVSVVANLEGVNLGKAMRELRKVVDPLKAQLPQGYAIEYGGQYEDMMDAFGQLLLALVLAILMVYMVMASQFESFSHPFTIMFTMPLAMIGVIWIFFLTRTTLSVPTFLGVIMLAGIVVNNGIVMVDYINQLRDRGLGLMNATIEGASVRLRPVLITSLTTIFAMVPMAVSRAEGSDTMSPLALTIIGGLAAASVFTLIVVPVVYTLVDQGASWFGSLAQRVIHPEEVQ